MIKGLYIAIPTMGEIRIETSLSLFGVIAKLASQQVPHTVNYYTTSDIVLSRNRLAAGFLADETCSHVLFVDSDMGFHPDTLDKLAQIDVPFAACTYPKRSFDLQRFRKEVEAEAVKPSKARATTAEIVSRVSEFTFRLTDFAGQRWPFEVRGEYLSVPAVGFGLVLLSREVLTRMIEVGCVDPMPSEGEKYPPLCSYGFFDRLRSEDTPGWLSEDFSFCKRWLVSCGGKIWVPQDPVIQHIGPFRYNASLREKLDFMTAARSEVEALQLPPLKKNGQSREGL